MPRISNFAEMVNTLSNQIANPCKERVLNGGSLIKTEISPKSDGRLPLGAKGSERLPNIHHACSTQNFGASHTKMPSLFCLPFSESCGR